MGAWQALQLKEVLDSFELTDSGLLAIATNDTSSN